MVMIWIREEFVVAMRTLGVRTGRRIIGDLRQDIPTGDASVREIAQWFRSLASVDQDQAEKLVAYSIWVMTFRWLCELDGISDGVAGDPKGGMYLLRYVEGNENVPLNSPIIDPELEELHSIFSSYHKTSYD